MMNNIRTHKNNPNLHVARWITVLEGGGNHQYHYIL